MTFFLFRYIFPVKDWIPIEQGIRKRDGKILEARKVEESRVAAVRSKLTLLSDRSLNERRKAKA